MISEEERYYIFLDDHYIAPNLTASILDIEPLDGSSLEGVSIKLMSEIEWVGSLDINLVED